VPTCKSIFRQNDKKENKRKVLASGYSNKVLKEEFFKRPMKKKTAINMHMAPKAARI
jgi:hypothetical protein